MEDKLEEIKVLIERGTFGTISQYEFTLYANVLPTPFVFIVKDNYEVVEPKDRFVIG